MMKRVILFKNGTNLDGKVIMVTNSLQDLLMKGSHKLNIPVAKCVYTAQGGLIDDISLIRDEDILYLSDGESFIPPPTLHTSCKCGSTGSSNQEWLSLNVGGRIYTTTRSTLVSKEPNSMLSRMFGGSGDDHLTPSRRDASGAYLIDRSYVYFQPLLNYLRTGTLIIDPGINPEGVLEEAKFYGLESIVNELEFMVEESSRNKAADEPLTRMEVISALLTTKPKQELRFQAVNLKGSNLSKMDLRNINFKYADMSDCNLSGANLGGCNLERANLSKANLEAAQLLNVKLLCANLEGANLRSCNFEDPSGQRANCEGVNLRGAILEGSMMAGVNLRVATLKNCNLKNCDLRAAVLAGADLENCNLTGSNLQETNLRGANLKNVVFELMQNPLHMSQTCDL
ncbi:UNVERIFIED_CONTAM: hypothetical protein GTU68_024613 [Idotea baltica]|nr:hypothetical protein [Idotea baltica]